MLAFYIRKEKPYSLKDVEFYLYLLVFVLSYLLMKEVFSRLPEPFEYFYPQLVAVIVGTIFFGTTFGLVNAIIPPLLFYHFIGESSSFLILEITRETMAFVLTLLLLRKATQTNFWNLLALIFIAEVVGMLSLLVAGSSFTLLLLQTTFLLPGMVFGSLLCLILLKVLGLIEKP